MCSNVAVILLAKTLEMLAIVTGRLYALVPDATTAFSMVFMNPWEVKPLSVINLGINLPSSFTTPDLSCPFSQILALNSNFKDT